MKTTPSALFSHTALLAAFALTLSFGGCKSAAAHAEMQGWQQHADPCIYEGA